MKVQDKALLVSLSISQWTARRYDKKATQTVTDHYHTADGVVRSHKSLIAKEALVKIQKIVNAFRTYHYEVTLPYMATGQSILATALMPEYMGKASIASSDMSGAVEELVRGYEDYKAEARVALQDLYDPKEYPSVNVLRGKFRFNVDFAPIPEGSDLRVNIDASDLAQIQQDIEDRVKDCTKQAMTDLWDRIYKVAGAIKERMTLDTDGTPKTFRDSLLNNVRRLADLLPKLNITDDPELASMATELADGLGSFVPEELRDNDDARKDALKKAEEVLRKVRRVTGGASEPEPEEEPEPEKEPEEAPTVRVKTREEKLREAGIIA